MGASWGTSLVFSDITSYKTNFNERSILNGQLVSQSECKTIPFQLDQLYIEFLPYKKEQVTSSKAINVRCRTKHRRTNGWAAKRMENWQFSVSPGSKRTFVKQPGSKRAFAKQ